LPQIWETIRKNDLPGIHRILLSTRSVPLLCYSLRSYEIAVHSDAAERGENEREDLEE